MKDWCEAGMLLLNAVVNLAAEARGRKRSRWDAELSPDQAAASQENAALDDGEIPPAEANGDAAALLFPPLSQLHKAF